MAYLEFQKWLLENGMTERSSRDVVSRVKRVLTLTNQTKVNGYTLEKLIESNEYQKCSVFIRSQLKRSVNLYLEFLG